MIDIAMMSKGKRNAKENELAQKEQYKNNYVIYITH